jgi:cyclophilin family peptidyl-prolyl cis-trans isomerase
MKPRMKAQLSILMLAAGLVLVFSQGSSAGTLAQFRTSLGVIDVELFEQEKPVTVHNFVRHVESGLYTNMFFHRWVPGFVVQGGGFFTAERAGAAPAIHPVPTFAPILNEYGQGPTLSNTEGTLAMARVGGNTNSATSQWFFNLADNPGLDNIDGGFTVFGRVLRGHDVLAKFKQSGNGVFRVNLGGALSELPVLVPADPTYEDLVYVDIQLLEVKWQLNRAGQQEIVWNSVAGRPNHIEYSDTFPQLWRTLTTVEGTGETMRITDDSASSGARFYRVRIDY